MNKQASVIDVLIFIIMAIVIVMFFALYNYGFKKVVNTLQEAPSTENFNISDATTKTFGQLETAQTSGLKVLAVVMILGMIITILITNFYVKSHPVFFIVYVFIVIGAFIGSVYLSNTYESLMTGNDFSSELVSFTGGSWILLHLPVLTVVTGVFGAIFLFMGIIRDAGAGGSLE